MCNSEKAGLEKVGPRVSLLRYHLSSHCAGSTLLITFTVAVQTRASCLPGWTFKSLKPIMSCDCLCFFLLLCSRISATITTDVIMAKCMNIRLILQQSVQQRSLHFPVLMFSHTPILLKHIIPSSTNDMLLRSTLKASVSLVRLLLFFTLEGCFAYDEMIVRVSGRERVVLNVVDSDQQTPPPSTLPSGLQAISFTFPPVCGPSAANLPRLCSRCLQHPPSTHWATANSAKEDFTQVKASK